MNESPIIIVPKYARLGEGFSVKEQLKAAEHPGRRTDGSQSPAHWITSLADAKKMILLCDFCRTKFNPRKHGYRKMYVPDWTGITDGYRCAGVCDACKGRTETLGGGVGFIPEELYNSACVDPVIARRNARNAWKAKPINAFLNQNQRRN